jgi:hypothetical protein
MGRRAYLANVSQISVKRFGGVHEAARQTEALHGRHNFATNEPALADATYNELSTSLIDFYHGLNCLQQTILRRLI